MVGGFGKTGACPSMEDLDRALGLPADSMKRKESEAHLKGCASCRTELALLRDFEAGVSREGEREAVEWIAGRMRNPAVPAKVVEMKRPAAISRRGIAALLAVAAALVIGINIDWRGTRGVVDQGPDVVRSAPLRLLSPAGDLDAIPAEFRWTPVAGAAKYELVVSEVDRTPVWKSIVVESTVAMPHSIGNLLKKGKKLQWAVTALDSVGQPMAHAGFQQFGID